MTTVCVGAKRGFVLFPRRWVVERNFGWMARLRRLARDDERLHTVLEGFLYVSSALIAVHQALPLLAIPQKPTTGSGGPGVEIAALFVTRSEMTPGWSRWLDRAASARPAWRSRWRPRPVADGVRPVDQTSTPSHWLTCSICRPSLASPETALVPCKPRLTGQDQPHRVIGPRKERCRLRLRSHIRMLAPRSGQRLWRCHSPVPA